ncbi:hypothetical protein HS088_TW12G00169 [Tripterygium wilfordii]|uniref:Embryo sac development arrest 6 n=1 Tax=Tripterygium wilfordii TaxID=458696 RepID=A0A7J7CY22_TRIWF|nr:uncharacterized protein LOC120011209 [Tripterygium wilfordii]KAF5738973.1 hypothetical protein HS088_TW12G00169 [Tripterygium wilfordii]
MNTKTMRLPPRRFLTPSKRKEPDGFRNSVKPSITTTTAPPPTTTIPSKLPKPTTAGASFDKPPTLLPAPAKSNQLIAGYLAHEFLSKGTLFGQPFDPATARAEIVAKKQKAMSAEVEPSGGGGGGSVEPRREDKCERYVDISGLLKREGTHIEGIVNPTQLARFLQL